MRAVGWWKVPCSRSPPPPLESMLGNVLFPESQFERYSRKYYTTECKKNNPISIYGKTFYSRHRAQKKKAVVISKFSGDGSKNRKQQTRLNWVYQWEVLDNATFFMPLVLGFIVFLWNKQSSTKCGIINVCPDGPLTIDEALMPVGKLTILWLRHFFSNR